MKKFSFTPPNSDKKRNGFTLIELIIVIVIIAILAAIAIPAMNGYINDAKQGVSNANAKIVYDVANRMIAQLELVGVVPSKFSVLYGVAREMANYDKKPIYPSKNIYMIPTAYQNKNFVFQYASVTVYAAPSTNNNGENGGIEFPDIKTKYPTVGFTTNAAYPNGGFFQVTDATWSNFMIEFEYDHDISSHDTSSNGPSIMGGGMRPAANYHFHDCAVTGVKIVRWYKNAENFITDGFLFDKFLLDCMNETYPNVGEFPVPATGQSIKTPVGSSFHSSSCNHAIGGSTANNVLTNNNCFFTASWKK